VTKVKLRVSEWKRIKGFLQTRADVYIGKPRECKRFVEGVLWIARRGAQWRLLPKSYGEWKSVFKRFDRWGEKGVWQAMMEHFAKDADMESVLIDATVVRAHSAAGAKGGIMRREGGFTTKIHAATDALGNPLRLTLTGGNRHDVTQAQALLDGWETERVVADKGYDSDAVVAAVEAVPAEAVIPPKANRPEQREYDRDFYKERHLIECFFNKLKQFRRVFSRFEQTARNFLAFVHFTSTLIWLR
jgi:transposase